MGRERKEGFVDGARGAAGWVYSGLRGRCRKSLEESLRECQKRFGVAAFPHIRVGRGAPSHFSKTYKGGIKTEKG